MNTLPGTWMSLIMVLAGIGIPIMAALNGGLGLRLGNPVQAAVVLFALALSISLVVLVIQAEPVVFKLSTIPPRYLSGGLFVAFYVLSVTFIGPKLGIGNAIVLVLLGQVFAAAMIDHFGLMSAPRIPLSAQRVLGLLAIASGIVMTRRPVEI